MEYITLQGDAKPSNYWVADYIRIGESWEAVSIELDGEISGLITPYGIDLSISIDFGNKEKLNLTVKKHLENIKGGFTDLKAWPFSQVIEASINLQKNNRTPRHLLEKNNTFNRFLSIFKGFKESTVLEGFIFYSNNLGLQNLTGIKELIQLKGFEKMIVNKSSFQVKLFSLPENEKENFELIDLIKKTKENIC